MLRLSTSSWSLHATLGSVTHDAAPTVEALTAAGHEAPPAADATPSTPSGALPLLDLPARLAEHGIHTLELCHFHMPRRDDDYLARLRAALDRAQVELFSLLIDAGDITQDDGVARERDMHWISGWLDVASALGATHARVAAGRSEPNDVVVTRSAQHLAALADHGASVNVQVITENWQVTALQPGPLLEILHGCGGRVGLCVDFGNAEGPDKYATLQALLPHATSVHAKPRINDAGMLDRDELRRCMDMALAAGFAGPVSLINTDRADEWGRLDEMRDLLADYVGQQA